MPSRFTMTLIDTARASLDSLPEADKDTREVSLREAIRALTPTLRKLERRGYSRQKLVELLAISATRLRSDRAAASQPDNRRRHRRPAPSQLAPGAAATAGSSRLEPAKNAGADGDGGARRPPRPGCPMGPASGTGGAEAGVVGEHAVPMAILVQPSKRSSGWRPKRAAQSSGTDMQPTAGRPPTALMASTSRRASAGVRAVS